MYELKVGVIVGIEDLLQGGAEIIEKLGLENCEISCWDMSLYTEENAEKLKKMLAGKVEISDLWAGWTRPIHWNFIDGPITSGLVPAAYRDERIRCLKKGADFAKLLGVKAITTHVGFIPENPATIEYRETIVAIREVAAYCKKLGLGFNFETGQETPTTLLRAIEDVAVDNLGINLDPANLLMYGKGNPLDAVDMFKDKIKSVHVKDGVYPVNGRELGEEKAIGEGLVNFPQLIEKLHKYGYSGHLTIEREISGEEQVKDIVKARELIDGVLKGL